MHLYYNDDICVYMNKQSHKIRRICRCFEAISSYCANRTIIIIVFVLGKVQYGRSAVHFETVVGAAGGRNLFETNWQTEIMVDSDTNSNW